MKAAHCLTRDGLVLAAVPSAGCGLALDDWNTHGLATCAWGSRRPETMINKIVITELSVPVRIR